MRLARIAHAEGVYRRGPRVARATWLRSQARNKGRMSFSPEPQAAKPETPSSSEGSVSLAMIEQFAETSHRDLSSIQAIAYHVEMMLPLHDLSCLEYLRKVQELVEECEEVLEPFVDNCKILGVGWMARSRV